jgi:hypothetical protein
MFENPSPNLSPTGGEALKTPFPCREGGRGVLMLNLVHYEKWSYVIAT